MDIGSKIAYYRKSRNLTQEELASEFNISNQAVSKWETGQSYPDVELFPRIADFFEISLDELFGREFTPKASAPSEDTREAECGSGLPENALAEVPSPVMLPVPVTLPVPEYRDTYVDNETLYAVLYQGSRLVHEEEIKTRFGRITSKLNFNYDGPALNVYSVFSVTCDNVQGNVTAGGYVACDDVGQGVIAGGYVACGDVGGRLAAGGYVECGDVGDSVAAGGYIECGDVGNNVTAGNYVECGDVGANVQAEGNIDCGNVGGNVSAEGDVDCGYVGGSVTAGGKVS